MYGYQGSSCWDYKLFGEGPGQDNLFFIQEFDSSLGCMKYTSEILYFAASTVVVYHLKYNDQRYFHHSDDVTSIALLKRIYQRPDASWTEMDRPLGSKALVEWLKWSCFCKGVYEPNEKDWEPASLLLPRSSDAFPQVFLADFRIIQVQKIVGFSRFHTYWPTRTWLHFSFCPVCRPPSRNPALCPRKHCLRHRAPPTSYANLPPLLPSLSHVRPFLAMYDRAHSRAGSPARRRTRRRGADTFSVTGDGVPHGSTSTVDPTTGGTGICPTAASSLLGRRPGTR